MLIFCIRMAFLACCTTFSGFVFSVYCCYCLYLGFTCYWVSTFNKLQSDFHVCHFFLISHMPYCFLYLLTSSRVPRVHHPALQSLRTHIPAVLAHGKAPSTFRTYHGCFKRWKSWASGFSEITYFPSQEEHVALYLISLVQSASSYSCIQLAFYSKGFFIMLVRSRILVNQLFFWLF